MRRPHGCSPCCTRPPPRRAPTPCPQAARPLPRTLLPPPLSAAPQVRYPALDFKVNCFFAVGSPAACFLLARRAAVAADADAPAAPPLPIACRTFYNIVNAADPVSYLCAPLVRTEPPGCAVPPALVLSGKAAGGKAAGGAAAGNGGGAAGGGGARREGGSEAAVACRAVRPPRYYLPAAKGLAPGGDVGAAAQLIRCTCTAPHMAAWQVGGCMAGGWLRGSCVAVAWLRGRHHRPPFPQVTRSAGARGC